MERVYIKLLFDVMSKLCHVSVDGCNSVFGMYQTHKYYGINKRLPSTGSPLDWTAVIPGAPISAQELDLNWPPCRKPFAYKNVGRLVDIRPSILNAKAGASFPASMEHDPNRCNILAFAAKLFSSEAWLSMELL